MNVDELAESDKDFWCNAINGQHYVELEYPEHGVGPLQRRKIQPLAFGRHRRREKLMAIRCYQVEPLKLMKDGSHIPRIFYLAHIESPRMLGEMFEVPSRYRRDDDDLHVICQLPQAKAEDPPDDDNETSSW